MPNGNNSCCGMFDGDPSAELIIDGEIALDMSEDGETGVVLKVSDYTMYGGPYEVRPKFEDQVLPTREKLMREDVTVNAITVSRVSNPAGGKTVFIGGQIDYA